MKRLICIFFSLLFLLAFIYAENEPVPFRKNMKIGKTITLTGSFVLFNGSQPNLRFVTDDNKIIGIGTDEEYCNEIVNTIVSRQVKTRTLYRCEAIFNYIGDVKVPYYEQPLMCFTVYDIKIKTCCIENENIKININLLKFNTKTKQLKCNIEIFNLKDFPINNPDASVGVCCSHKVVAVGFNTLCYDAERQGIKPSARINYSNMFLNLKYDGENYRAYMDSSASNRIDFSKIEIPTKEKIKENIYFSFNGKQK